MARKIRVALIGAGGMANRYHYPSLATFPDLEIAASCDLIPEKARGTAERFGIPRVDTDYRRMLAEVDPEAVWVLMPPQHLYEPVSAALQQGRHVFIEKPLALTTVQARMLAYFAETRGLQTMVGFQRRHIPAVTDLRRRVEQRGPIHYATVSFLKATRDLSAHAGFYDGAIDPLTSDGIHAVDNLRWLCGGEVVDVHAVVRRRYIPGPIPNEYTALITFSSGAVGVLQSSYVTGRRIFRVEFHGRNATAYVDADADSSLVVDDGAPEGRPSKDWGTAGGAPGSSPEHWLGFWHENRHFVDCLQEGRLPTSHFGDAVKSMELVERILRG
ncbi:MAG TPA: Gfo/Idh/MocA family oxidoreductase [Chloroflexota bacterium]|nr:Gfo/Idh/MocA family oxidoreductase [Chloroflexota bacterium]